MSDLKINKKSFLKDVFICSLGAYGGPESHYGVFIDQLIKKKRYLDEEELVELIALCSILPGPTSTQTIVSVGYKIGGPLLAMFTMLIWAIPALTIMTVLAFLYQGLNKFNISSSVLSYIGPMAVGFIIIASFRIGKKVIKDKLTITLLIIGAVTSYFIRTPWIFPLLLILGGITSVIFSKERDLWNHVKLNPPWKYLILFVSIIVLTLLSSFIWDIHLLNIFESFYRYGYLIFGGGQVVVPVMFTELVEVNKLLTNQEFLTGYGLVQGIPGPMFSFSAFAGGMASRESGALYQVLSSLISGIAIFLPGLLLIFFVYPVWENLKKIKAIKISLKGINAIAGGLISASAVIIMQKSGFTLDNIIITLLSAALLLTKKIPAPIIVLFAIIAGVLL